MLFESTKTLLRSIVQSLENGDESGRDDRLECGLQCLYELHQMSRPSGPAPKSNGLNSRPQAAAPISERAIRAIPHVRLMVSAIRRRDQGAALQSGRAAMTEMVGGAPAQTPPPAPPVPQVVVAAPVISPVRKPESVRRTKPPAKSVRRHAKPMRERHPVARKPKAKSARAGAMR